MAEIILVHDVTEYNPDLLLPWQRWSGEGDPPAYWWATDPDTGEACKVYRSYADYCAD